MLTRHLLTALLAAFSATALPVPEVKVVTSHVQVIVKYVNGVPTTLTVGGSAPASTPAPAPAAVVQKNAASSSAPSSTPSSSAGSGSSGSGSGYNSAFGIAFSQYDDLGKCKDSGTLASNIKSLSGFKVIRLYDVDCDLVKVALQNKGSDQKLMIGIFHIDQISAGVQSIQNSGATNNDIYAVSVGNENVDQGKNTVNDMTSAVKTARDQLNGLGFKVPVVIIDTFTAIKNNPALCQSSDFVAANAHAYFSGGASSGSGDFVKQTISDLKGKCDNKNVIITETGWPTKGNTNGKAVASKSDQTTAINSILGAAKDQVVLFTGWNELWKEDGNYGVEKYWGLFN